jgi:hypothetical protein
MTRKHPVSILLLLFLALCVLDASYTILDDFQSATAVFELEEGLEESMDDLPEEEVSAGTDIIDFKFCPWVVARLSDASQQLTGACKLCPSLCSFGWILPLRI